jgi:heme/copper-type cytochrome/quinol oxidase subunit 4
MPLTLPGGDSSVEIYDPLTPDSPDPEFAGVISGDATIGDIVTALIPYVLGFAGLILFVLIMWGGFLILTAAGNEEKVGKGRMWITSAIIGFVIIFAAYWIMQVVQAMFGVGLGFGG